MISDSRLRSVGANDAGEGVVRPGEGRQDSGNLPVPLSTGLVRRATKPTRSRSALQAVRTGHASNNMHTSSAYRGARTRVGSPRGTNHHSHTEMKGAQQELG